MTSRLLGVSALSIFFLAGVAGAAAPKETAATRKSAKEIMARIRAIENELHDCKRVDVFVATQLSGKSGARTSPPETDANGRIGELWATHACGKRNAYTVMLEVSGKETVVVEVEFAGSL